ncbi:hypothetical protein DSO57_1018039 [Entomophthora muscae]|uniref:Uncharacterized protein n=1 Tax=Entomophthora muscae TaxID=34485 RepID=A0ACC2UP78_9FUNG|nr:hypothetical protein DSO57_1018039 [Entomophthora muscae]
MPKAEAPFNSPFYEKRTVQRGQKLPVEWLRQNHPGGFVRISMSTFESSDNGDAFDGNTIKYVCYETNCREDHHEAILGKDNGPGSQKCSTEITIPDNLPDGPVTLQWTWFGGGVLFADQRASFANYVSCSDMVLKGGLPYRPNKVKAEFQGGDAVTQDKDKCRYWSTNSIFGCPRGAEDKNKNGCGYGEPRYGAPAEWLPSDNRPPTNSNPPSTEPSSTPSSNISQPPTPTTSDNTKPPPQSTTLAPTSSLKPSTPRPALKCRSRVYK